MTAADQTGTSPNLPRQRGKSRATLELEDAIVRIVDERAPVTVRGVAYALFALELIPDMSTASTKRVSRVMTEMREAESLDWTLIVDDSRTPERPGTWDNVNQRIESAVRSYRRDRWQDQPRVVEVWSEKGTVQGVLQPVLREFGVTFRVMKGFGSFTAVRQAAEDSVWLLDGRAGVVLYLGDFDPSGLYMSQVDLPDRLERYGSQWTLDRIALLEPDLKGLPSFDVNTKAGDSRYEWYRQFGTRGRAWELDAMDPNELRARVRSEIQRHIETDAWEHAERIEKAEVESMREFSAAWLQRRPAA